MTPGSANLKVEASRIAAQTPAAAPPVAEPRSAIWQVMDGGLSDGGAALAIPLDLRTKRDLHSRRIARYRRRTAVRIGLLLAGDVMAAIAAVLFGRAVIAERLPVGLASDLTLFIVITVLGQAVMQTYGEGAFRRRYDRVWAGVAISAAALAVLVLAGAARSSLFSPDVVLGFLGVGLAICLVRVAVDQMARAGFRRGHGVRRTIVIGDAIEAERLTEKLRLSNAHHVSVVGRVAPTIAGEPDCLGGLGDLHDLIETRDVSNVIVSAELGPEEFKKVVHECLLQGVAIGIVPSTLSEIPCQVSSRDVIGWPMIELDVPRLHLLQVFFKRTLDFVVSLIGLLLLAPVILVIAVVVKLSSPGPVFFRQPRVGLGGSVFDVLKFRTMRVDAEEMVRNDPALYELFLANDFKLPDGQDPRVTRIGAFLRRTSLDELPQLINVVRGQMSLVGPRPVVPPELENYGAWTRVLLGVRPGVTGHWQISGRSSIRYPERAHLDLQYITKWSLWLDLRILCLTVPAVLRRKGAH